jgi:hypothetical protein
MAMDSGLSCLVSDLLHIRLCVARCVTEMDEMAILASDPDLEDASRSTCPRQVPGWLPTSVGGRSHGSAVSSSSEANHDNYLGRTAAG